MHAQKYSYYLLCLYYFFFVVSLLCFAFIAESYSKNIFHTISYCSFRICLVRFSFHQAMRKKTENSSSHFCANKYVKSQKKLLRMFKKKKNVRLLNVDIYFFIYVCIYKYTHFLFYKKKKYCTRKSILLLHFLFWIASASSTRYFLILVVELSFVFAEVPRFLM